MTPDRTTDPHRTRPLDESAIRRIASISLIGSTIEWYDFFIFGTAAALVFPTLFFPAGNPTAGVLLSFSVFGVAFLARPVGGIVWGHFGDLLGRKKAFLTALFTMAAATVLIGVLPAYATIGIAAPIILTLLRVVQGLAVGGQWGGAVLLATEFAPPHRRGFYGSFVQIGVPLGVILGQVLYILFARAFTPEFFAGFGWRIPFLLSAVLVGVALYAQRRLEDTPAFRQVQQLQEQAGTRGRSPVLEALRRYPRQIFLGAGTFVVVNATFYLYVVYMLGYGTTRLRLPQTTVLTAILIASVIMIFALAGFAALSDRIGRRRVYLAGAVGTALWAFPFFWLADTATGLGLTIALVGGLTSLAMMYGPQAAFFAELFSPEVRYSGASLGYQIGAALGGGFAPIIATALLAATGTSAAISAYMAALALLAVGCVLTLSETRRPGTPEPDGSTGAPDLAGSRGDGGPA